MKPANPMLEYVEDLFADLGTIRVQKMFGGAGVYVGEEIFALIDNETIYLKTDDIFKAALLAEGGRPFSWKNRKTGQTIEMSYVSLPESALDDHALAASLGRKALEAARHVRQEKVKSPRRRL